MACLPPSPAAAGPFLPAIARLGQGLTIDRYIGTAHCYYTRAPHRIPHHYLPTYHLPLYRCSTQSLLVVREEGRPAVQHHLGGIDVCVYVGVGVWIQASPDNHALTGHRLRLMAIRR